MHLRDVLSEALGAPTLNAMATAQDAPDDDAEPWDDGNGVRAVEPGVVIAFERNTRSNKRLRQAGVEVIEVPGDELARVGAATARGRGDACSVLPDRARRGGLNPRVKRRNPTDGGHCARPACERAGWAAHCEALP